MIKSELTDKERQIILLVSRGNTCLEIAETLGIGKQTVKNHMTLIREKLAAKNAPHAVSISISQGIIIN